MSSLIIFLMLFILFLVNATTIFEKFGGYQMFQQFIPINTYKYPISSWWNNIGIPIKNGYTDLPWNNMQLGVTHNMSYDLRGDPIVIPRTLVSPWNNPEVYPIYNTGSHDLPPLVD